MVVKIEKLQHKYRCGPVEVPVLDKADFSLKRGDFIAVMGSSGVGKSTLLHILGCLLQPDGGSYLLNGEEMLGAGEKRLAEVRSSRIGQIFQMFHLLPEMDVRQNIALPFLYRNIPPKETTERVNEAIDKVRLSSRTAHKPAELSGGEMQRVAIARVIAQRPEVILADEPTGNLDKKNSRDILELFAKMHREGHSIVMVTHDPDVAGYAGKILRLQDGRLHEI